MSSQRASADCPHSTHLIRSRAPVDTTTLADFCSEGSIETVEFLKIDAEGFDLMVLKGVPWAQVNPEVILCEFEDKKTKPLGYDYEDLANFLLRRGYTLVISEWHPPIRYGATHASASW